MLKQLGFVDLHKAIAVKVNKSTKLKCYDKVPLNASSPFYFLEIVGKRQENTKTMYCDVFTVWIHAIAKPGKSSVEIYKLIQKLEESLSEPIDLPNDFDLIRQSENGLQKIQTDETDEKHAIIEYEIKVCYGFKCKN